MSIENEIESVKMKNRITKKDFVYWIFFLMFIIVLLLVWRWDNEQQLTNQISLVGSVSSILLALIAIGYAFFQSQSSSDENRIMLNTLIKIKDEINKLESVNNSLSNLRKDLMDMKIESSTFQEKMEVSFDTLKLSLKDNSWLDSIESDTGEKISPDLKEKLEEKYSSHIEQNLEKAFQIDSDLMAKMLTYIYPLKLGEKIDEKHLGNYLLKHNLLTDENKVFHELAKLSETGIISFVVDKNDEQEKVFAIKTGQPALSKAAEEKK